MNYHLSLVYLDVEAHKIVTIDVVNKENPEKVTGQFEIVKVRCSRQNESIIRNTEFEMYKDGKKVETLRTD